MRVDRILGRAGTLFVTAMALGATAVARAEGLFGTAQVQFHRIEGTLPLRRSDGTTRLVPFARDQWIQSYDLNHRAYPRQNVLVQSTLRLNDQFVVGSPERQTVPLGSVRVMHPYATLFASIQPVIAETPLILPGATPVDSATATSVRLERRETQLVGRLAVPNWPSLDLRWLGRRNEPVNLGGNGGVIVAGEKSRQRTARLGYAREAWNAYAEWSDQKFEREVQGTISTDQRILRSGVSLHLAPAGRGSLLASYDLTDTRSGFSGSRTAHTLAHSAQLNGDWRHTPKLVTQVNGNLRSSTSTQTVTGTLTDAEGALLTNYYFTPRVRATAGGGTRTVRTTSGQRLLSYFTTLAAADGEVRHDWTANSLLSNTVNWDPERGTFAVQTVGGYSRMRLHGRGQLDGDLQFTANGDTATALQRYSNSWGLRLSLEPLRSLTLAGSMRSYRVGAELLTATGVTRTRGVDVILRPMLNMDLTASWVSTGLLPSDSPRIETRSATGRWTPWAPLQLTGSWSKSDQVRTSTAITPFRAREIASGRAFVTLSRRLSAAAGFTVANPGSGSSSKEFDAILTWSFGR